MRVVFAHVFRNALLPVVTMLGLQLGTVLGGSVVVESVFSWPGIGTLLFDSVTAATIPWCSDHDLQRSGCDRRQYSGGFRLSAARSADATMRRAEGLRRFVRNRGAVLGVMILLLVLAIAGSAGLLFPERSAAHCRSGRAVADAGFPFPSAPTVSAATSRR